MTLGFEIELDGGQLTWIAREKDHSTHFRLLLCMGLGRLRLRRAGIMRSGVQEIVDAFQG
jgi:hypothetical protein